MEDSSSGYGRTETLKFTSSIDGTRIVEVQYLPWIETRFILERKFFILSTSLYQAKEKRWSMH